MQNNTKEFRIDGYLAHPEDIYDGYFEFKQEENRVLYPFMKLHCGGKDILPQYCNIMKVAEPKVPVSV